MTRRGEEPVPDIVFVDPAGAESEQVEVIELDREEFCHAVEASLRDAGLTYRQLARQARTGQFTSLRARKLWLAIGETGGAC